MSDGGKGDSMRPTDKKAFDDGMDRIFGVKKPWYIKRNEEVERCAFCGEINVPGHNCQVPMTYV